MWYQITDIIVTAIGVILTGIFSYLTYRIARDVYEPFVSFNFSQIEKSHLAFHLKNDSKVEVEVFGKLWADVDGERFEFNKDFYGDGHSWILQPFMQGQGHFELTDIANSQGNLLKDLINNRKVNQVRFSFQIRYRAGGGKKWKKSSPQHFVYNLTRDAFWLDV